MVYFGQYGRKHLYKFGETGNIQARLHNIRCHANDKSFNFIRINNDNLTKVQDVFIESYIRLQFEAMGYNIIGNDHIRGNKNVIELFDRFYQEGLQLVTTLVK